MTQADSRLERAPDLLERAVEAVTALRSTGATLSVAESCTGGWLGREITSVPGASACFWGGVIAYDNAAKLGMLSVSHSTLSEHGAVSRLAAEEMARGVADLSGSTWALAITGLAGPDGGTPGKPVGTVWIAVRGPISNSRTFVFAGNREEVRRQAVYEALGLLVEALRGP
ncbi:MAG: CinA family protein [Candidatus Palauibacterales bacterium]|nr:CinA family protein [Candidatus Palauibacterales bacterium]